MQEMGVETVKDGSNNELLEQQHNQSIENEPSEMLDNAIENNDIESDFEVNNESENAENDESGEMPSYMKKHFRRQEKMLKRELRERDIKLSTYEAELQGYRQLFNATYGEAQRTGNSGSQQAASADDVEAKVLQTLNKVQQQQVIEQQRITQARLTQEFQKKLNEASDRYDDFDDVVYAPDNPISKPIAQIAHYLPNAGDVIYALSKNKQELMRINRLDPDDRIMAMAAFAFKLATNGSSKVTQAPKPVTGQVKSSPTKKSLGTEGMSIRELKTHLKNKHKRR